MNNTPITSTANQHKTSADGVNGLVYDSANSKLIWVKGGNVVSSPTAGTAANVTMQLTSTGKLLASASTNGGAKAYSMTIPNKGTASPVRGGSTCNSTIVIYGPDAFCMVNPISPAAADKKVLRLEGAGSL